ncbi:MAG: InlB B-repeat-containing protein [Clostridiales bacterium]|nr:InlB B-repeat-containing protein [Clostridiales bacterium]
MRKIGVYVLTIFMLLLSVLSAACNSTTERNTAPKTYTVEFGASVGGRIEGNTYQTVSDGGSTQKVVAIADYGYYFVGWVDSGIINSDETIIQDERIIHNVREDRYFRAEFARKTFQVKFIAGENGRIEGELVQSGKFGDETLEVTAVPDVGYNFVAWSDGVTEPTRKERFIENKEITANFGVITQEYTYNYKYADSNCDEQSISLTYGQLDNIKFVVPSREHATFGGWYADRYLTQQVSDENGNIVIGNELFLSKGTQLYAKWVAENTHKYKILIVYVTELNAELTTKDGNRKIQVNYKMTDIERQICQMITEKISFELNDLAVADFQVDEYFTTVPLTKENIQEKHPINSTVDHKVYAYDIPEVQGLLQEYDSVLVSYSMDDYFGDLHNSAGEADSKYGSINFDCRLTQLIYYNEPIENLLDPLHYYWDDMIETYLHEFAHTIELCVNNIFEYHKVDAEYLWDSVSDPLIAEKLYFLNKAVVGGEKVGVPYEYWEGKVSEVYYETTEGGKVQKVSGYYIYVIGHSGDTQYVLHGDDALTVIAIPMDGYEFVGWSDGVKTATRQDTNITSDLHIYAFFKKINL